jgi:hypothetical protein
VVTKGKPGPKCPLTPEVIAKIVEKVRAGNYLSTSVQACGISRKTCFNWLKRGNAEDDWIEAGNEPHEGHDAMCYAFMMAAEQAEALAEIEDIRDIRNGVENWQSKAWIRERRSRENWGRFEKHEVTGKDGEPLQSFVFVMPDGTKCTAKDLANASSNR